ncbi:MAG: hydantoinase/oxoprolinase family protein [Candidatus Aminicenantes bacterium]|nr:hydantoinase/oxoprolinase family protein [Candidatus Aminicenantes bacterium]
MIRIGIDTGGTFTDFVFLENNKLSTLKLPSTPKNPALAILQGLELYAGKDFELVHGTTVSTNAFLQKKMAGCAFLCTKGFEHILYIGRQNRTHLFSLEARKPSPIVPLSLCFGIDERTLKDGTVRQEPSRAEIETLARKLKEKKIEAVGILFLHSYKNPQNEQFTAKILREQGFHVTASHEILPEYREYERAVVTILNSALKPVISGYVDNLQKALRGKKLYIIQSNGGVLSPARIVKEPIHTIISGPAGGVIAAQRIAGLKDYENLITLDMGGTSTDVSVIKAGEITLSRQGTVEHLPLRLPMIDIATVGAGGGSIARIDRGGVLQVGPESAGADPGPACYGKSNLPTVSDAFVVTGVVRPEMFLGGKIKIFPAGSRAAIEKIAAKIGRNIYETAEGIIRVSISAMERALRSVTLEKGEDPRYYTLMPFGGAGGLVAAMLAEKLGIQRILAPPGQGVFSALGMLVADFKKELYRSFLRMHRPGIRQELEKVFAEMSTAAEAILTEEGFAKKDVQVLKFLEIRYKGQSYELVVPFSADFIAAFHQKHRRLYSYTLKDDNCEIVNLRVLALGKTAGLRLEKKEITLGEAQVLSREKVYFNGRFRQFSIYRREDLKPGNCFQGPAIVAADDSTLIVSEKFSAEVDEYENILLTC